MRRLAALALATLMTLTPLASAASYAGGGQWGVAVWWSTEQGNVFMYWVLVYQGASTAGQGSNATVARVRCTETKKNRLRCPEPRQSTAIPPADFTMDPTMESATLDTTIGGIHHTLTWTARDEEPVIMEAGWIDDEESYHFVSVFNLARIRGEVFGRPAGPTRNWIPTFGRSASAGFTPEPRFPGTIDYGRWQIEVVSR